jgi:hypothetical protein
VLRCRECRHASVVLDGVTDCPRCGHAHRVRTEATTEPAVTVDSPSAPSTPAVAAWLLDPAPLSIWLGGARYLGGHAERDKPISAAGLLLDQRGIHVRAFADLFVIPWSTVSRVDVDGPLDITERISMPQLVALGASTWATTISYLTVHTDRGDAIFEIDGLSAPELRARLSRVLQALEPSRTRPKPIPLERSGRVVGGSYGGAAAAKPALPAEPQVPESIEPLPPVEPGFAVRPATATSAPTPAPAGATAGAPAPAAAAPAPVDDPFLRDEPLVVERKEPSALVIDPASVDAPVEVLVVDALWKLAQLRDNGLLGPAEVSVLRAQLLARVADGSDEDRDERGPLRV